jgi:hypothetical protein
MSIKNTKRIYLTAKSLLSVLMLISAGMYIFNPQPEVFVKLGYPGYLLNILAVAKILGVISLWVERLKYIRQWAYAGFFYDVVLAFTAHVYIKDGEWQPALAGIIFVLAAVLSERRLEKHS